MEDERKEAMDRQRETQIKREAEKKRGSER